MTTELIENEITLLEQSLYKQLLKVTFDINMLKKQDVYDVFSLEAELETLRAEYAKLVKDMKHDLLQAVIEKISGVELLINKSKSLKKDIAKKETELIQIRSSIDELVLNKQTYLEII